MTRRLKRIIIKEELVELTGSFQEAIILNQFIYWTERAYDYDKFKLQEIERAKANNLKTDEPELLNGWIYKSAQELSEETMLGAHKSTIRRYINSLVENGFLMERCNPKYQWDKTKQYRVDIAYINRELNKLGYCLDGYSIDDKDVAKYNTEVAFCENGVAKYNTEDAKCITEVANYNSNTRDYNNNYNNNISSEQSPDTPPDTCVKNENEYSSDSDVMKLTDFMIDTLKKLKPDIRVPVGVNKQKWCKEFDRLLRIDNRDKHEVCEVIRFAARDDFWQKNILSPSSLRKSYDRLVLQMRGSVKELPRYVDRDNVDETRRLLEQRRREREQIRSEELDNKQTNAV
jgi:hypothetical protein